MRSTGPTPNRRARNARQQLGIARYITRFRALRRTLMCFMLNMNKRAPDYVDFVIYYDKSTYSLN